MAMAMAKWQVLYMLCVERRKWIEENLLIYFCFHFLLHLVVSIYLHRRYIQLISVTLVCHLYKKKQRHKMLWKATSRTSIPNSFVSFWEYGKIWQISTDYFLCWLLLLSPYGSSKRENTNSWLPKIPEYE